jgi:hypothetical protein
MMWEKRAIGYKAHLEYHHRHFQSAAKQTSIGRGDAKPSRINTDAGGLAINA